MAVRPSARRSEAAGESLSPGTSRAANGANIFGNKAALARNARLASIARYRLARRGWRTSARTTSGSRLPAAINDACTATARRASSFAPAAR